jgi:hypothetical protein
MSDGFFLRRSRFRLVGAADQLSVAHPFHDNLQARLRRHAQRIAMKSL